VVPRVASFIHLFTETCAPCPTRPPLRHPGIAGLRSCKRSPLPHVPALLLTPPLLPALFSSPGIARQGVALSSIARYNTLGSEKSRLLGDRLVVGQLILDQPAGVRIPVPQPHSSSQRCIWDISRARTLPRDRQGRGRSYLVACMGRVRVSWGLHHPIPRAARSELKQRSWPDLALSTPL
jgi:hypothetical protein